MTMTMRTTMMMMTGDQPICRFYKNSASFLIDFIKMRSVQKHLNLNVPDITVMTTQPGCPLEIVNKLVKIFHSHHVHYPRHIRLSWLATLKSWCQQSRGMERMLLLMTSQGISVWAIRFFSQDKIVSCGNFRLPVEPSWQLALPPRSGETESSELCLSSQLESLTR